MWDKVFVEFLVLGIASFIVFIIRLNIWYRRELSKMTPEERERHELEHRIPGDW